MADLGGGVGGRNLPLEAIFSFVYSTSTQPSAQPPNPHSQPHPTPECQPPVGAELDPPLN